MHRVYEDGEEVAMHVMNIDRLLCPARMERRALRRHGPHGFRGCSVLPGGLLHASGYPLAWFAEHNVQGA